MQLKAVLACLIACYLEDPHLATFAALGALNYFRFLLLNILWDARC